MKKSLIIVCGTLEAGGAERVISILSSCFTHEFERVEVMMWRDAPIFYSLEPSVILTSIPKLSGSKSKLRQIYWFRKYVISKAPDCVLSFLAPFNMLTIVSLFGSGVFTLVAERNDPRHDTPNLIWRLLRNFIYVFSDGVSVQSQMIYDYFPEIIRTKSQIIYNPLFMHSEMIGRALQTMKSKKIVAIGRLVPAKNLAMLIDAFAQFHELYSDYKLFIYGEGILRANLERKIMDMGLSESIILPGVKQDIYELICDAEIFVLSSNYEGMPNVLLEAMSLGLPCISTKVSGAIDLIQNYENGILIDVGSTLDLAVALKELVSDKLLLNKIATNAVAISRILDKDVISSIWMSWINRCINDKIL